MQRAGRLAGRLARQGAGPPAVGDARSWRVPLRHLQRWEVAVGMPRRA